MAYSENFKSRFFTSILLGLGGFLFVYLGINYINILACIIFLFLFYEINYLFFKKNYIIFFQLFLILLLQFSYFKFNPIFYTILILNFVYIITLNYLYKINIIYLITSLYFFVSMISIFSLLKKIENIYLIYIIIMTIIFFDIFSYVFGKLIKGKKLLPKISPGKTISGLILGFLFSFLIIIFINHHVSTYTNNIDFILFIILILLSAIIGDILESIIKRKLSIKDISNLLPGHGGFFDRFDSFLFTFITINIFYYFLFN